MSRRARIIGGSGYMHIYARGINRQDIFLKQSDYSYFLKVLSGLSCEMGFDIVAYCLMPNHFHLIIYDKDRRFSKIIKRLSISYAMHFNAVYERVGPLFQGRFGSKSIEDIDYLMTVVRYVHFNPEKAGICKMDGYKWSSYKEYLNGSDICSTGTILQLFGGVNEFREYHMVKDNDAHKELEGMEISDEEAVTIVCNVINDSNPEALQNYSNKKRDMYIKEIRECGISTKQLSRITGLSIYVIRHVPK